MNPMQDLFDVTSNVILGMRKVLSDFKPNIVLVHGDTTTTSASALAAFYHKIKVGHIEAGLRTNNIYSPWPEEANRQITSVIANFHFAPTRTSQNNLLKENIDKKNILICGNTVIDSLFLVLSKIEKDSALKKRIINDISKQYTLKNEKKIIYFFEHLITNILN